MTHRADIAFTAEGGVTLRGWLFIPDGPGPHPAITMAHGYAV
jgi:cephalosporin-C deacetylase-like acetyl esterase